MAQLMADAPKSEIVRVAPFAERAEGSVGALRAGKHARAGGAGELAVLGFRREARQSLHKPHHLALAIDDVVVDGGELDALLRAALPEDAERRRHLHALAAYVDDVALCIRKEVHPVFIRIAALEVEVSVLCRHGKVNLHGRNRLPLGRIVADIAVAARGSLDDVHAIRKRISAGGLEIVALAEAVNAEHGSHGGDALDEDGECLALLEVDARGIFVGAVRIGVLQLIAERIDRLVGLVFPDAVFRGIVAGEHVADELPHKGVGNLLSIGSLDAIGKLGAEGVLEVFLHEVRKF